tara:strand:+ start:878 stop:1168 length:291 start_codon:yes stop_codon:yes gene_type:complete
MNTTNITNNPWNKIETLAELVLTERDPNETSMDRGFRLYRRAQLLLQVAGSDVDPVDAEAWTGVARADLAKACWAFQRAGNDDALRVVFELGARLG